MNEITINAPTQILREMDFDLEEPRLQEAFDKSYREVRKTLALPGYRPGRVPLHIIKRIHGEKIEADTLASLAGETFDELVKERSIRPLGPVLADQTRTSGNGAHIQVRYEVLPEFELKDISGVVVERPKVEVAEESVDRIVEQARFTRATRLPVVKVDGLQIMATVLFRGNQERQIYLSDPDVPPEVRDSFQGKTAGDSVTLKDPSGPEHEVTIKAIESIELPELTDELAVSLDPACATVESMRDKIRSGLMLQREGALRDVVEERTVTAILELYEFEVPNALVNNILDSMQKESPTHSRQSNYAMAKRRAAWLIMRDRMLSAEGVEITDEDLEKLAKEEAAKYGVPESNLLKYYHKHGDDIRHKLSVERLWSIINSRITIKDEDDESNA